MHLLFKLSRLPRHGPPFEHLNPDPRTRFNTTLVPDPELQQASYEACRRGEVPEHPAVGMQIPTVMDPSLAPGGFHARAGLRVRHADPRFYLCRASCHPGPGVTFPPGHGAAHEVAETLRAARG